jgi:hypothetical protein
MTDFQAAAGQQGRQFAEQCDGALRNLGFELEGRRIITEIGVEIDQASVAPSGRVIWFEYKGSIRGAIPGLRRTDTTKKAIANGALIRTLQDPAPFVVLTSHLPLGGSAEAMVRSALAANYISAVICIYNPGWEEDLRKLF